MAMSHFGARLELVDSAAIRTFDGTGSAQIEEHPRMAKRTSAAIACDLLLLDQDGLKRL
jgi:hypothetical protein